MRLITCVFTLMILTLGQAFNDEQNDQRSLSASQDRFVRFFRFRVAGVFRVVEILRKY